MLTRISRNPILGPGAAEWESFAAFNGNVFRWKDKFHLVYRGMSDVRRFEGKELRMSSIGHAVSSDGLSFKRAGLLVYPETTWDRFGCEDPRVTVLGDKIVLFYTAIGAYPFVPDHIRVGVALFEDIDRTPKRHLVTPFNAKAMALFPEKVNGKLTAILTVNTDEPPAAVGLAHFDAIEDLWNRDFWLRWYRDLAKHTLRLQRINTDQVEVGAPPLLTERGWLLIYCRIQNYGHPGTIFGVEAALLDKDEPSRILARSAAPLLVPQASYERTGTVGDVVFPSGAAIVGDELRVYYGAADTVVGVATCSLASLLASLGQEGVNVPVFERWHHNPVLTPRWNHTWERLGVYNPGVFQDGDMVHVVYRAQDDSGTSFMGLATFSPDGTHLLSREPEAIYGPREPFEEKAFARGNSGCEDPRLTVLGDRVHMLYTAYRGDAPPRIAWTWIALEDFRMKRWDRWAKPMLISEPDVADKDACFFPEKINGRYVTIHRIEPDIVFDFRTELDFDGSSRWLESHAAIGPRPDSWEGIKIGANAPPVKTPDGWILLYHGVGRHDHHYRLGALLLDLEHPSRVIGRTIDPLLQPEEGYECYGQVHNVIFPCGVGVHGDELLVFYGGADSYTCLARGSLQELTEHLKRSGARC